MNPIEPPQNSQQIIPANDAPSLPNEGEILRNDIPAPAKPAIFTDANPLAPKRFVLPAKSYAQNKLRSADKDQSIVDFLGSGEVWSSLAILTHVLKIEEHQSRVTLDRMVDKKLLKKETLPDGLTIYGITNTGIAMAKDQTNAKPFQIGKTPLSTVKHHLLTQKIRLFFMLLKTSNWLCGKALYKDKNYHLINIADGCFQLMGLACVLEIELFVKSHKRMKKVLENYVKDMSSDPYGKPLLDRVYYFTPHTDLIEKLIDLYVPEGLRSRFVVMSLSTKIPPYRSPKPASGSIEHQDDGSNE